MGSQAWGGGRAAGGPGRCEPIFVSPVHEDALQPQKDGEDAGTVRCVASQTPQVGAEPGFSAASLGRGRKRSGELLVVRDLGLPEREPCGCAGVAGLRVPQLCHRHTTVCL